MSCKFSTSTAKEDGAFAVAFLHLQQHTYDNKPAAAWNDKEKELKANDVDPEEIALKKELVYLQAKRLFVKNSFDFIIESVGVFENRVLLHKACDDE